MRTTQVILSSVAVMVFASPRFAFCQPQEVTKLDDLGTRRFGTDWPGFLGPTGDGKSPERGIRKDWNQNPLRIVWDRPLIQSYGICTVSKGRVFQFDSYSSPRGVTGLLWCLHSETGKALWKYEYEYQYEDMYNYNAGPRTSPIVDGNRVYALGVDGMLICLRASDGKELWKRDTSREFGVVQNFFGVGSNPVIAGDLLVVMVGGSPSGSRNIERARGNGSGIVAFDKQSGDVKYQVSDELASYASLKYAEHQGRPWCFAFMRGGLLTFDPRSGAQDFFFPWRAKILQSVNASVPVVIGNQVFISETYGPGSAMLEFTNNASRVVWQDETRSRRKSMQTHWNTAIHHQGFLYGSSGRHTSNAELRCIEAATGEVQWSEPGLTRSSLLYVDGHLVCLSEDGTLRLVKATPEGYHEVAQAELTKGNQRLLEYPAWAAPVLSHGLLYLRGNDRLVCAELIPN